MAEVTIETIIKFIEAGKKIVNMEKSDKSLYHMRVGLKMMNGPYLDFKYSQNFMGKTSLEIIYSGDCIYEPTSDDIKKIKQAIEIRQQDLVNDQVEKKKKEFIKIVEDL